MPINNITIREEFEKGFYSFRFEYTDEDGNRRYEVGVWNDGMPPQEALKNIARYVSEFKDGKITDFIDNKYFLSKLTTLLEEIEKEVEGKKHERPDYKKTNHKNSEIKRLARRVDDCTLAYNKALTDTLEILQAIKKRI